MTEAYWNKITDETYTNNAGSCKISPPNAEVDVYGRRVPTVEDDPKNGILPPLQVFGPFLREESGRFDAATKKFLDLQKKGWHAGRVPGRSDGEKFVKIVGRFPPGYVPPKSCVEYVFKE